MPDDERMVDASIEALRWWRALKATSNEAFLPLFFDQHRFLVLCGGGGSGKSIFAGRKILERCATEPGHRWLVCRKVGRTLRHSCWDQLVGQWEQAFPGEVLKQSRSDMTLTLPNGSQILFAGLDDPEKLKSIYGITGVWIEEASEIAEADLNQLDIRLRDKTPYYKQIIITFNPISARHWLKQRFFDRADERVKTHRSTYLDNRFVTPEQVATLESFRETDEYFYQVYALGQWGVTGRTYFSARAVQDRIAALQRAPAALRRGCWDYSESEDGIHISEPRWVDDDKGPITIYREPEAGRPYVIGGDTAGEGSDYFVAQVLDNVTGEQVATLRQRCDEDDYTRQVYCLGMYYNTALVGLEVNFSTYPTKLLQKMGYGRQYVREVMDTFDGSIRHSYGFATTRTTRPAILGALQQAMRTQLDGINDLDTLDEMLTFIRPDKDPARPEAEQGAHDDTIMALAIAWHIRGQQTATLPQKQRPKVRWTADMWEDWHSASASERLMLTAQWGEPLPEQ